ncbi:MAG: hypothetical protein SOX72_08520 [Oscillospiraceae bacterium]|nr:hypothetical protein [Oscillospiraceae bacterium]
MDQVKKDPKLLERFRADPVKTAEKCLRMDLPDEIIEKVADGVKAALASSQLSGAADALKKLFWRAGVSAEDKACRFHGRLDLY